MTVRVRYLVGLLTILAAAAGGYWLLDLLRSNDRDDLFTLRILVRDSRGLKAGADVKYRGVRVGAVQRVDLQADGERAVVVASIRDKAVSLVSYNSRFWIVTPRFLGLTQGASGLDTLIRDAYVSFQTPEPPGPPLPSQSEVLGLEQPPPGAQVVLSPIERGDLVLTLLVPENHSLSAGARVMFRGMQTGELRRIVLSRDGTHVELELRVHRDHRGTVTDKTKFWIARPRLSGALLTGLSLEDTSALISPFIGYHTVPNAGVPVPDNYRVAALPDRPDIRIGAVPAAAVRMPAADPDPPPPSESGVVLVHVFYDAVERDWWSPDDSINRQASGVLIEDGQGRIAVATARSACDGAYFDRDTFGAMPDIELEQLRVVLPDGTVLQASRTWTAPDDVDLALLVLVDPPSKLAATITTALDFGRVELAAAENLRLLTTDERGEVQPHLALSDLQGVNLESHRGGAVVDGTQVVGILGQAAGTDPRNVLVSLQRLPEGLRPRQ